jgi:Ca2+-binding EF-hand superfamily protein
MVDQFQAHDDDGDGLVTVEEFGERYDRIVSRFDTDGDGAVTLEEMRSHGDRRGDRGRERAGGDRGGEGDGGERDE